MSPTPLSPVPIDLVRTTESYTAANLSVVAIFHAIALIFVTLRVYIRAVITKAFRKDDILMVVSSAVCSPGSNTDLPAS